MAAAKPKKAAGRSVRTLDSFKGKAPAAKASKAKAKPKKAARPASGYGKYVKHKESSGDYTTHVASYWRRR